MRSGCYERRHEDLVGLGDYGAGDSWWGAGRDFDSDRVNHQGGSAVGENGIALGAEGNAGRDHTGMRGAIGTHGQDKIRNVARGHPHGTVVAVIGAGGIEVSSS